MSCMFRAVGCDFDVDEFLCQSNLTPDSVYHRGKPDSINRISARSGFTLVASEADFDKVQQQIADAIEFLKEYQAELEKLQKFAAVETACLDFGIEDRDIGAQYDYFPPELLHLAGNLNVGIELSRYPIGDE